MNHERIAVVFLSQSFHLNAMVRLRTRRPPHARTRRKYLEGVCPNLVRTVRSSKHSPSCGEVNSYTLETLQRCCCCHLVQSNLRALNRAGSFCVTLWSILLVNLCDENAFRPSSPRQEYSHPLPGMAQN